MGSQPSSQSSPGAEASSNSLDSMNGPTAVPKWPWLIAIGLALAAGGVLAYVFGWV